MDFWGSKQSDMLVQLPAYLRAKANPIQASGHWRHGAGFVGDFENLGALRFCVGTRALWSTVRQI